MGRKSGDPALKEKEKSVSQKTTLELFLQRFPSEQNIFFEKGGSDSLILESQSSDSNANNNKEDDEEENDEGEHQHGILKSPRRRRVQFAGVGDDIYSKDGGNDKHSSLNNDTNDDDSDDKYPSAQPPSLLFDVQKASRSQLLDRVEMLQQRLVTTQISLATEKSVRKRKQKCLLKLAREMGKRQQEFQTLQVRILQLSELLADTNERLKSSHAERDEYRRLLNEVKRNHESPTVAATAASSSHLLLEEEKKDEDEMTTATAAAWPSTDENVYNAIAMAVSEQQGDTKKITQDYNADTKHFTTVLLSLWSERALPSPPKAASRAGGRDSVLFQRFLAKMFIPNLGNPFVALTIVASLVLFFLSTSIFSWWVPMTRPPLFWSRNWCGPVRPGTDICTNLSHSIVLYEAPWWVSSSEWKAFAFGTVCGSETTSTTRPPRLALRVAMIQHPKGNRKVVVSIHNASQLRLQHATSPSMQVQDSLLVNQKAQEEEDHNDKTNSNWKEAALSGHPLWWQHFKKNHHPSQPQHPQPVLQQDGLLLFQSGGNDDYNYDESLAISVVRVSSTLISLLDAQGNPVQEIPVPWAY